jgi:hypothetical protein
MSSKTRKGPKALSLKDAFEVEFARREMDRRKRDEEERRQQEADLEGATQLEAALRGEPEFLAERDLTVDRRRYTVSLDHRDFRIAAYFEAGKAGVTLSDKRTTATPGTAAPRKREIAESVDQALAIMAQYLVDETR